MSEFNMKIQTKSVGLGTILVVILLSGINASTQVPRITVGRTVDLRNAYNTEVTLTCEVDFLNDQIAWMYNGEEKFSCDFPYAAGMCTQVDNYSGYVDIRKNVTTLRFLAQEERTWGNWTCVSGANSSKPFTFDTGYSPEISEFSLSRYNKSGSGNVTLTCSAESNVTLDKFSIVLDKPDSNLVLIDEPKNMTYHVMIPVPCTDFMATCCVYNRYGNNCSSVTINTNCKLEIKENMTNFVVEATEGDETASFRLFYTGEPVPQFSWYREYEDGMERLITDYRTQQDASEQCDPYNVACISLRILKPMEADSGNYTIRVNETTSGLNSTYKFVLSVTLPVNLSSTTQPTIPVPTVPDVVPTCEAVPDLTFGEGIGVGIAIGICSIFFVAGVIYGCRDS